VIGGLVRAAPEWTIDIAVFKGEELDLESFGWGPSVRVRVLNFPRKLHTRLLAAHLMPSLERYAGSYDVMLGPVYATWPSKRAKEVAVIHDLTYKKYPRLVSAKNLVFLNSLMRRVARRAALVLTVSSAIKKEISDELRVPSDRIAVIYPGVDMEEFSQPTEPPKGVPSRYLLFVGTLEPRKNLRNVLAAYASLRRSMDDPPSLVIAGGRGWGQSGISKAELEGVILLGYVDHSELTALYANAIALLFPSVYEGFGIPVLEAMAAGSPVITSKRGGLVDAGGEAVVYVDPDDPQSIAEGVRKVMSDGALRSNLIALGRERAAKFTWDASGAALKAAIEAIVPKS
jgi:glycosyltransferase involved in cell wall biosynthesis